MRSIEGAHYAKKGVDPVAPESSAAYHIVATGRDCEIEGVSESNPPHTRSLPHSDEHLDRIWYVSGHFD